MSALFDFARLASFAEDDRTLEQELQSRQSGVMDPDARSEVTFQVLAEGGVESEPCEQFGCSCPLLLGQ